MDFAFLFLLLSSPAFFAASVVLFSLGQRENVAVPFLMAAVFSALIGMLGFRASVIMGLKRFNHEHFQASRKIGIQLSRGTKCACFEKTGKWICVGLGQKVAFDLRGLVFKKAFLTAFATRAFRYQRVSSGLPWTEIGRLNLKGFPPSLTACAEFRVGRAYKRVQLCKNGASRLAVLPWFMVWCCAPQTMSFRFWRTSKEGLNRGHYDEEMFCSRFAKIKCDRR